VTVLRRVLRASEGRAGIDRSVTDGPFELVLAHDGLVVLATSEGLVWARHLEGLSVVDVDGHAADELLRSLSEHVAFRDEAALWGEAEAPLHDDEEAEALVALAALAAVDASASERLAPLLSAAEARLPEAVARARRVLDARTPFETPLPRRPRVGEDVQARIHRVEDRVKVLLHGPRAVLEVAPEAYGVLTNCDGTRDLEGLCLAAARGGFYGGRRAVIELLESLQEVGFLADGRPIPRAEKPVAPPAPGPPDRPLATMSRFVLRCDGRGSCCRFYGSVSLQEHEAWRAAALYPEAPRRLRPAPGFSPLAGTAREEGEGLAMALVDGACQFLEADHRCGLHARGGPEAKPRACRVYPFTLVDDGEAVRVGVAPECACVYASDGAAGEGAPPEGWRTLGDVPPGFLRVLPDRLAVTGDRVVPREALRGWTARLVDHLIDAPPSDPAAYALALAEGLERHGLEVDLSAPVEGALEEVRLERLAERVGEAADAADRTRSASDLSRRTARWLVDALAARGPGLPPPEDASAEVLYLRALAFAYRISSGGRPLADGFRDRAARIVAARWMARLRPERDDPAERWPLALVEAALRNLGIGTG
jgi:lysine-N-methylase